MTQDRSDTTAGFMLGALAVALAVAAYLADAPAWAWFAVGLVEALLLAVAVRNDS